MTEKEESPAERRITVVLADDDRGFVESLRGMVDEPRLSVVGVAGDGLEALELVDELAPEAVVIDLHMPRLDGVSALARMRQDHPRLCLIAITADAAPELHRAAEEAGADAVLMKDELPDELSDRIVAARAAAS
ncbi:MAG TPA: response regulator transcription factor [Gaiellaceae bacterium]|nr:response regulator transcription factor [Gaiellaceae bacterium]HEX2433789.1 response regulator transcription factor [Gaiellaceae bacterium]